MTGAEEIKAETAGHVNKEAGMDVWKHTLIFPGFAAALISMIFVKKLQ